MQHELSRLIHTLMALQVVADLHSIKLVCCITSDTELIHELGDSNKMQMPEADSVMHRHAALFATHLLLDIIWQDPQRLPGP